MAIEKKVNARFTANGDINKRFGIMERAAARFGRKTDGAFKRINKRSSRFLDIVKGITAANLLAKGFETARRGIFSFITEAAKIETATAGFTPLLKSVTRAEELVEKLNQTASTTPFKFEGIADVAKQLLPVMNDSIEDTIATFRMLGDTAGGNIQKLDSITRGYTKALLKGKPDMEALNMIAEAGVPIFSEMAESMGITKAQLFEMSKKGKLTSSDLTKAFKKMTSEGGIFFRGMEIASETFDGKLSTLMDNIALTAATIGKAFLPSLKAMQDELIGIAKNIKAWAVANQGLLKTKFENFLKTVRDGFFAIKPAISIIFGALVALSVVMVDYSAVFKIMLGLFVAFKVVVAALSIGAAISSFIAFTTAVFSMAGAMGLLNVIMAANPVGAIIVGITALVTLFVFLEKKFNLFSTAFDFWSEKAGQFANFLGFGDGEIKVKGGGVDITNKEDINITRQAPNAAEAQARAQAQSVSVGGTINVNGPSGTTVESEGPVGFNLNELGLNGA